MQINFSKEEGHFSKKTKIEYIVKDYTDDVYLEFSIGLEIDIYLYQIILFTMIINNTSSSHRVRRFSIFIENSDDKKENLNIKFKLKIKYKWKTKK